MAKLSTHVLDTAIGKPAAGLRIDLYRITENGRAHRCAAETGGDGRTAGPLLSGDRIPAGVYELVFAAADYFKMQGTALTEPPFLGDVVIRFGISDETASYHVPLLLSPYGYSTYRGS